MLRKSIFAIAAVATITAASLIPTTASAHGFKGWYGGKWGYGVGFGFALAAPLVYNYGYNCIRWVQTPYGLMRTNVCRY